MALHVVILAAGNGKRMHSKLPKVLHPLAGVPILMRSYRAAKQLNPERIHIVVGHGSEHVADLLDGLDVNWIEQKERLGTGHAVSQVVPHLKEDDHMLVLVGDVPLITDATLRRLISSAGQDKLGLLSANFEDPKGLGRILRNNAGDIQGIREHRDCSAAELTISEINSGIMLIPVKKLQNWLPRLSSDNAQGEYYLTDIVAMAVHEEYPVVGVLAMKPEEVMGVNDRQQLAALERVYQRCMARQLMAAGVTIIDPNRFDLRGTLHAGQDSVIDVNVVFEGDVSLGDNVRIGPNCVLRNCRIGNNVEILSHTVIEDADIGTECSVGPFARIRPGTCLHKGARVGNFVELKKSTLGEGSKVNHLSYVGDAVLGKHVNVGAGTITCNYDGVNKHKTVIGDGVFIGSNTQLVAPVQIGTGATIGAGSTITKDVEPETLALSRSSQRSVENWARPEKKNGAAKKIDSA